MQRNALENLHKKIAEKLAQSNGLDKSDDCESLLYFQVDQGLDQSSVSPLIMTQQKRRTRWIQNVRQLEAFVDREGLWPRQNSRLSGEEGVTSEEHRLATWVRKQRVYETSRCDYQALRLACIPGYELDPSSAHHARRRDDYTQFCHTFGRAPRASSDIARERSLARWAYRQTVEMRQELSAGAANVLEL